MLTQAKLDERRRGLRSVIARPTSGTVAPRPVLAVPVRWAGEV